EQGAAPGASYSPKRPQASNALASDAFEDTLAPGASDANVWEPLVTPSLSTYVTTTLVAAAGPMFWIAMLARCRVAALNWACGEKRMYGRAILAEPAPPTVPRKAEVTLPLVPLILPTATSVPVPAVRSMIAE